MSTEAVVVACWNTAVRSRARMDGKVIGESQQMGSSTIKVREDLGGVSGEVFVGVVVEHASGGAVKRTTALDNERRRLTISACKTEC